MHHKIQIPESIEIQDYPPESSATDLHKVLQVIDDLLDYGRVLSILHVLEFFAQRCPWYSFASS